MGRWAVTSPSLLDGCHVGGSKQHNDHSGGTCHRFNNNSEDNYDEFLPCTFCRTQLWAEALCACSRWPGLAVFS